MDDGRVGVGDPSVGRDRVVSPWPGTLSSGHPARDGRVLAVWVLAMRLLSGRSARGAACRHGGRAWLLGALVVVVGLPLGACDGGGAASTPGPAAFPGSAASLDELGRDVWQAMAEGDTATVARLRLTRGEYIDSVWPELPASRPEINFPTELAWLNLASRDAAALEKALRRYHGSTLRYVATSCDSVVAHPTFRMHSGCRVTVAARAPEGGNRQLELFRHAVERDGGWKVVRYYDPED